MKIREYRKQIVKLLTIVVLLVIFIGIYMTYIINRIDTHTPNNMTILLNTFFLSIGVILFILGVLIYISISDIKKQKKLYEYAYIDPETKKRNIN